MSMPCRLALPGEGIHSPRVNRLTVRKQSAPQPQQPSPSAGNDECASPSSEGSGEQNRKLTVTPRRPRQPALLPDKPRGLPLSSKQSQCPPIPRRQPVQRFPLPFTETPTSRRSRWMGLTPRLGQEPALKRQRHPHALSSSRPTLRLGQAPALKRQHHPRALSSSRPTLRLSQAPALKRQHPRPALSSSRPSLPEGEAGVEEEEEEGEGEEVPLATEQCLLLLRLRKEQSQTELR